MENKRYIRLRLSTVAKYRDACWANAPTAARRSLGLHLCRSKGYAMSAKICCQDGHCENINCFQIDGWLDCRARARRLICAHVVHPTLACHNRVACRQYCRAADTPRNGQQAPSEMFPYSGCASLFERFIVQIEMRESSVQTMLRHRRQRLQSGRLASGASCRRTPRTPVA